MLEFSRRAQERPLAILKALIAFGGKDVPEFRITDALWPDADGDTAHQTFGTTLHRLRKLLKYQESILVKGGKVSLNPSVCWVDRFAFAHLLAQADSAETTEANVVSMTKRESALAFYQGHVFMNESQEPWTTAIRERLQTKYVNQLITLCEYWAQNRQRTKARAELRKVLEWVTWPDRLRQTLQTCHNQMTPPAKVLRLRK